MAAINKNFVIKNGLEVSTDLILADPQTNKVGIGTTAPQYLLHVNGGIGVTNAYVSGITTVINELRVGTGGTIFSVIAGPAGVGQSVGVGTARPAFLLDVRSPVSTGQTALYVQGDIRVTGDLNIDDISITNLNVSGVSTFVGFATFRNNIFVAGISTFVGFVTFRNNIFVAGISTFVGFTTFNDYVFIQDGLNVTGAGATLASLNVSGVSTFVGFATFNNNILVAGIGTVTTLNSTSGTITNLTGTSGTITTFNSTSGTITNLVSISGTITNLTGTSGTITTFNSTTGNITNITNTNLNVTGIATIATLNATGIGVTNFTVYNALSVGGTSTFTNGPVLIGSGTSTGTASQTLQVTGGTYVSGNLGIGSTNPTSKLHVVGDVRVTGVITATTFSGNVNAGVGTITNLTGTSGTITTFNSTSGTITNLTGTNVSYSGIGTVGSLNIASTQVISSARQLQNIASLDATTTATIEAAIANAPNTFTDLTVTGISTLGTVKVSSGIITATSGIVTYFGNGNFLNLTSNPSRGIGIGTTGGVVGYAVTFINFKGSGVSTAQYNSSAGIATIFFEGGGGGGGSISISTTAPLLPGSGDLWYSPDYGRTFIYYDESVVGYGTDAFWVDAAPFNVGIITALTNVSFSPGSAVSPSMFFVGDNQTGFFSPGAGQFTVVSSGSSVLNVNASGIRVTGVITATSFVGNGSGLTGAGSTVFNNTTTNQEFFPLFTATTSGTITASGISTSKLTYNPSTGAMTAVDFNSTSDINLKENIHTVGNALEITEQLRGVSFDWKETGRSSYGVIAQELEEVLPELVKQGEVKSVNYNGIIGVLIEAIKELKKEVEYLKNTK